MSVAKPNVVIAAVCLALPTSLSALPVPEDFAQPVTPAPALMSAAAEKSFALLGRASRLQQIASQQAGTNALIAPAAAPGLSPARGFASHYLRPLIETASDRPDFFGSAALPVSQTPLDAQWRRAGTGALDQAGHWRGLVSQARAQDRRQQIEAVNRWVNAAVAFSDDRVTDGRADRWAAGAETLRRGRGDCEDYAIAKMQLLRTLGFAPGDLYLTLVKDLVRQADHAVLVVRHGDRFLVLDNSSDRILESGEVSDYRPVFTYSATGTWVHGYRRPDVQIAGLTPGGNTIGR